MQPPLALHFPALRIPTLPSAAPFPAGEAGSPASEGLAGGAALAERLL